MIFAKKLALEIVLKQIQIRFCEMDIEESNLTEDEYRIFGNQVKYLTLADENCEYIMTTILDKYCIEPMCANSKAKKLVDAVRTSVVNKYTVMCRCLNQVIPILNEDYCSICKQLQQIDESQGGHYVVETVSYNVSTQERVCS